MAAAARRNGSTSRPARGDQVAPIGPASASTPEQTVARLHSSGRRLILPAVVSIAACGAAGYLTGVVTERWAQIAVPLAAATVVVLAGVFPFLYWANRVYVVTTRRLIARRGFFTRERRELLHSRANEVVMHRGPLQSLAGSGDIAIRSGGDEVFRLVDVPDSLLARAAIVDLIEHSSGITPVRSRQPEATRRPFDP